MFAAVCLPASSLAKSGTRYSTPSGYDENDYQKVVAFMEAEDENGVKNGDGAVTITDAVMILRIAMGLIEL